MKSLFFYLFVFLLFGCSTSSKREYSAEEVHTESKKLNEFFETEFQAALERSPERLTAFGIKKRYAELDDKSYANFQNELSLERESYQKFLTFNRDKLDDATKLSYDIYQDQNKHLNEKEKYFFHRYFVNQMYGRHTSLVELMMDYHTVTNEPQAWSYISRLEGFEKAIDQLIEIMKIQKEKGIKYPHFVFEHVIRDSQNILKGAPFQNTAKYSDLLKDFRGKIARIDSDPKLKNILMKKAMLSMNRYVKPGYQKLIAFMQELEKESQEVNGVWAQPDGQAYYAFLLKRMTTTNLSPQQIHNIGLKEVSRIHDEMKVIMGQLGHTGSLMDFFKSIQADPKLHYTNNYVGRQQYLNDTQKIIDDVTSKVDDLFDVKPKAKLVVKPVEKYREKSAGIAFYERPAPDGSRPGVYYVNLADMSSVPKYDMEALAYHEAIPGHHMQISIAQELEGVPQFRLHGHYGVYSEGWGLYAESLPKELGFFQDPYSDFGRLSMELWRATRLVVDTGIHFYKWNKQQAIDYMASNTPNSDDKILKEVERYFIMPGQAVTYKVGQMKILELRLKAKKSLKEKFDIKKFHDVVLKNGAVPFTVLEKAVDDYIASQK